jgi:hypothetical protein
MAEADPTITPLVNVADEKLGSGREQEILSNIALREKVAGYLLYLFILTNAAVLLTIGGLALVDYHIAGEMVSRATTQPAAFEKLLMSGDVIGKSRSVNSSVLIALITATAAQVGAGVLTITQYLFPRPKDEPAGK